MDFHRSFLLMVFPIRETCQIIVTFVTTTFDSGVIAIGGAIFSMITGLKNNLNIWIVVFIMVIR